MSEQIYEIFDEFNLESDEAPIFAGKITMKDNKVVKVSEDAYDAVKQMVEKKKLTMIQGPTSIQMNMHTGIIDIRPGSTEYPKALMYAFRDLYLDMKEVK